MRTARQTSGRDRTRTPLERSAGGVVYWRRGRGAQVALIATEGKNGQRRWGLPKGLLRKAESAAAAARREVREETGLEVEIEAELKTLEYWFFWRRGSTNVRHHKQVTFYLMRPLGGSLADHDHEVLEARWFALSEAAARLSFDNERAVLRVAVEKIREGQALRV